MKNQFTYSLLLSICLLNSNAAFAEGSNLLDNIQKTIKNYFHSHLMQSSENTQTYQPPEENINDNIIYTEQNKQMDNNQNAKAASVPAPRSTYASYDPELSELYDALGSLHYLQNLCYAKNTKWRDLAQNLNNAEQLNNVRKSLLVSQFNTSYLTFADNYESCTDQAKEAYKLYKAKGLKIAQDLLDKLAYREQ